MKKLIIFAAIFSACSINAQEPVCENASNEAKELLSFIYSISGKYTLVGQHCQPLYKDVLLERAHDITGSYPALYGQDFGFSPPNSLDGINFRQRVVDDAIAWHKKGVIITLMWHAAPPNLEEPVNFKGGIMCDFSNSEWKELLTDGTEMNNRWKSQVDVIAFFLKQLRDANVPVIWRPYHEMNGPWFWWGGKPGENGYAALYRMLYERLVNYHKINNLIWVFNGNEINPPHTGDYENFYPGDKYVDILATDVYRNNYSQVDYDNLLKLANGKPIALGEVGHLPTPEILKNQPKWAWLMLWADHINTSNKPDEIKSIYDAGNTLTLDELNSLRNKK